MKRKMKQDIEIRNALNRIDIQLGFAEQLYKIHDQHGWATRRYLKLDIAELKAIRSALLWVTGCEGLLLPDYSQEDVDKEQARSDALEAHWGTQTEATF